MNTNILGSGSHPVSFVGQLSDRQKLFDMARDSDPAARAELSRVISSILEVDVTAREGELVADVLIKLMRQAETDLRQAISEQISTLDNVPLRLVLQLANDDIDIARPVLTKSNVLGELDLMYIIKSKTSEYWEAIATRESLSNKVIDVLADTNDFDTALTLAENANITLTEHALTALSDIAQDSEVLAMPLLRRAEVPSKIASKLYEFVGEEVKKFISNNYDLDYQEVAKVVDETVQEFAAPATSKDFMPEEYMIEAAQSFLDSGVLNVKLMLSTLRRGHMRSFVAQLSAYTKMPVETIGQILSQTHGQGLAVVAKAFNIEKSDFISIFMLTSKIWNHGRLVEIEELKAAITYYDKITLELAMDIIKGKKQS